MKALLLSGLVLAGGLAASADELPRPAGVGKEDGSPEIQAMMGEQPVKGQGFVTALSVEAARAFYLQRLPKQGWRVGPMPGMTQAREQRKNAEKAFRESKAAIAANPELQAQVARYDPAGLDRALERVVYAERGPERLMVVFTELGPQKTMVILNRYEGKRAVDALGDGVSPAGSAQGCCVGGRVPDAMRQLPAGIPAYPKARPVTTGGLPQMATGQKMVSEMAMTHDTPQQVGAFYQARMAAAGWAMEDRDEDVRRVGLKLSPLPGGGVMDTKLMIFRKGGAICTVAIGQMPQASALLGSAAPATPAPAPATKENLEDTLIMITYLETKSLKQEAGHGLPFAAPAQR